MVARKHALASRHAADHALVLAARAARASAPPDSWWTRTDLTWDQFTALAEERARELNAVATNQHVVRRED